MADKKYKLYLITWTWALIIKVSASIKPSSTFDSSINFFHPQSCSFFQNRCNVSSSFNEMYQGPACSRKENNDNNWVNTRIFGFFWIFIHNSDCELGKMTPPYTLMKASHKNSKNQLTDLQSNSMLQYVIPGRSLSWFATQRNNERWLQTSQPCG